MKTHYEAIVKERMAKEVSPECVGGCFRGQPYPHIFKELKDNFIDGTYPTKKCLKGNLTDEEIKYHYAEHLNSSQAMCIAYFKKFFESTRYEMLLTEILVRQGLDVEGCGEFTDAIFEYIPYAKEGTNFDFFLKLANGKQITWEIKFTESEFGGTTKTSGVQDRYIAKYKNIYIPMREACVYDHAPDEACDAYHCLKTGLLTNNCQAYDRCEVSEFYRLYQIRRNILYAKRPGDYVLFLTPKENQSLDESRAYIEQYAASCGTECIRNIYWESLLNTTIDVVSGETELLDYYTKFRRKYFGE